MDGVIILKTFEGVSHYESGMTPGVFFLILLAIAMSTLSIIGLCHIKELGGGTVVLFILGAIFMGIVSWGEYRTSTPVMEPRYEVYVEDSVSMNEFISHYEILEQDGVVFTVREVDK